MILFLQIMLNCNIQGCQNVIVLDGNMKNCRQVCSCKNVTELKFDGLQAKGCISVGKLILTIYTNTETI